MNTNESQLIQLARKKYNDYELDRLPESLKRNSLKYYYLGVYPSLPNMQYIKEIVAPQYPATIKSLYVHTPFCSGTCEFCNYFRMAVSCENTDKVISKYFNNLKAELNLHAQKTNLDISYIYFGGGTPSLISPEIFADFLNFMSENNFLAKELYGTVEIHPEIFLDRQKADKFFQTLQSFNIKRISVGYQFDNSDMLINYNRRHVEVSMEKVIAILNDNKMIFNIDLMYGLPGQTLDQWEHTLSKVVGFEPDSISSYFLFSVSGTPLYKKIIKGETRLPAYSHIQIQHIMAQEYFQAQGFSELPSDFFMKMSQDFNKTSSINLPSESISLSLGPGTYSFFDNVQFINVFDLKQYEKNISQGETPIWRGYRFNGENMIFRDMMFSFKNSLAIDIDKFVAKYQKNPLIFFDKIFNILFSYRLVDQQENIVRLTSKGRLCADEISFLFRDQNIVANNYFESERDKRTLKKYNFSPSYPALF